jgi:serine/threonine protein kinase
VTSPPDPSSLDPAIQPVDTTPLCDGRFEPLGRLGSGSQAETLAAIDRMTGCAVAIKRFDVRGASSWKDVELAEREARVLSTLHHPALPAYVHHFEQDGALYLVMQKVEGQDLARRLAAGQRFSLDELAQLLQMLGDVFDYLHGRSPPVLHRDVKPSNIVLGSAGGFFLIDFGSVRDGLRPMGGSTVVGTFGYMAPEQFQGRALPATDLYGAGATILTLLTGTTPDQLPHRGLEIDVGAALPGTTPLAWIELLQCLLSADPDKRSVNLKSLLPALRSSRPAGGTRAAETSATPDFDVPDSDQRFRDADAAYRPQSEWIVSGGTTLPPLLIVILSLLRVALFLALQVVIPTLLTVLSVFLGKRLRQVATEVARAGHTTNQQLSRAIERMSHLGPAIVGRRSRRGPPEPWPRRHGNFGSVTPVSSMREHGRHRERVDDPERQVPADPPPVPSDPRKHRR